MVKLFNSLEIRDTNAHNSEVYTVGEAKYKATMALVTKRSYVYKNGLNQDVALQIQGCIDEAFTNPVDMGAGWTGSASMSAYDIETQTDYMPYLRVQAQCTVGPASGDLDMDLTPDTDDTQWE